MEKSEGRGVSVIVLDSGRRGQLAKLVKGLDRNTELPEELILVRFSENGDPVPPSRFPVVEKHVANSSSDIPFAAGRNLAASVASGDFLVFLGLDCLPGKTVIADYADGLASDDNLWLGRVSHLHDSFNPYKLRDGLVESLSRQAPGVDRADEKDAIYSGQREKEWSLSFGIRKSTFDRIGGFDERYFGFGGEDLDFMIQATRQKIGIGYLHARVWHQFQTMYHVPVQHLDSIVRNARIYREKWGYWPSKLWLEQFSEEGFIQFDPASDLLEILDKGKTSRG